MPFELDGKTYKLRCNMNVLADVQEAYNGDLFEALSGKNTFKSLLHFLAAMLNDYADEMGWEERYTAKQLGRKYSKLNLPMDKIMSIVVRAVVPDEAPEDQGN